MGKKEEIEQLKAELAKREQRIKELEDKLSIYRMEERYRTTVVDH